MLGKARICNSCGRKTLALTWDGGGLYAKCMNKVCGFRELVWWPAQGSEPLRRILADFDVNPLTLPICIRRLASGIGSLEEPPREVKPVEQA